MELIESYKSDESLSEQSEDDIGSEELERNQVRSVYLVTYSQADKRKFPTRRSFDEAVVGAFSHGNARILHWCCSEENHSEGGKHYHLALKVNKNQRWLPAKEHLMQEDGISVHFSNVHHNYYSAWTYVTKEDEDFIQSENHPRLQVGTAPITNEASRTRRGSTSESRSNNDEGPGSSNGASRRSQRQSKKKRISAFEVSEIIVSNSVKTLTELQAIAFEQKEEGKTDLAEFLIARNPRAVADILTTAWEIEGAKDKLERASKTRLTLLNEAKEGECEEGCHGQWIRQATEILHNNNISEQDFTSSVRDLLVKGRGKYRNIMIIGPADCGKTFLFNPLRSIFKTFSNPASGTFAWVGVDNAEVIFLNDFRWTSNLIPWHDLLLLLEGQEVHFPAPKTHFAKDISLIADTPIFSTSKGPLRYIKNGIIDERETEMMKVRWNIYQLHWQIPRDLQRDIPACGKCFASFIIQ